MLQVDASGIYTDIARSLDPCVLMRDGGFEPDPWQADRLRSSDRNELWNCARQTGKSETASGLAVHTAQYKHEALAILISPSERQSDELLLKCRNLYNSLRGLQKPAQESTRKLELQNGSRIVSLPASEATIRGFSAADLILVDEASRVPDEVYNAIRPMLAVSRGRFVAVSTPFGRRGWWFREWTEGHGWTRITVTAAECKRITPEWLAEEKNRIGPWAYAQEFDCKFQDSDDQFFASQIIASAFSSKVTPLWV